MRTKKFCTNRPVQTVKTLIRLLFLDEQSEHSLHVSLFCLHIKKDSNLFESNGDYNNIFDVKKIQILR